MDNVPVSRRSVATGLAWAVPAVAVTAAAPAFAASPSECGTEISAVSGEYYSWGTQNRTTDQWYHFAHSATITDLPADAVITSMTAVVWTPNRIDDGTSTYTPWQNFGAYEPGHRSTSFTPASGFTCSTSYENITGCDLSSLYRRVLIPRNAGSSSRAGYTLTNTRNGTPLWWEPGYSDATVRLTANWTDHVFKWDGTTQKAWALTYTADVSKITADAFTMNAAGTCKTFWTGDSPLTEIVYNNVLGPSKSRDGIAPQHEIDWTITYTSGGREYTLLRSSGTPRNP